MSDQSARIASLDTGRSILLQAPAGSGKTTVLAQRFLAALAQVDEPEEVLAVTFTRKAAAEMRERVLLALQDDLPGKLPDQETWQRLRVAVQVRAAARNWRAAELPQRLRIQTIDSLAHEIARAMPVLGRMQTSLQVTDDATDLYLEAARETLRLAESEAEYRDDADRLLRQLDNNLDQAVLLLADMLPGRNRWLEVLMAHAPDELAEVVARSLARIVGEALQDAARVLPQALRDEAVELARRTAGHRHDAGHATGAWIAWLAPAADLDTGAGALQCWQAVAELALTGDGDVRKRMDVRQGFPPADRPLKERWREWIDDLQASPGCIEMLRMVLGLPLVQIGADERDVLAALSRLLLLAAAHLKVVFRAHALVDHSEVAAIARQALQDEQYPAHPVLNVAHLLVDEFQDTSPEQVQLVRSLVAAEHLPGDRSLFLVGDPMQSIYMFRDSEVGLFLQTRSHGLPPVILEPLHLRRNFRSERLLVEWANRTFAGIFPASENLRTSAVTFLDSAVGREPRHAAEVQVWPQTVDDPAVEAASIAAQIKALRAGDPGISVAVLVQKRALAAPVLRALGEAGVPVVGVDLASLSDRPAVRDLVALGQALLDAGDRAAWLAVLRSPPCGLLLADLLRLCERAGEGVLVDQLQDEQGWLELSADARMRLRRVAPLLVAAWRQRGSIDVASHIENTWQCLGGEAASSPADREAAGQYLLALRRLQEQVGVVAPSRLAQLAARLKDHGEATGEHPVEVLTIHHAKGLEWDAVFVPGLGAPPSPDRTPLLRWLQLPAPEGGTDLLLAVRSMGESGGGDPLSKYIARLQSGRQQNERLRLLYVAVTRARRHLFLSGYAPPDKEGKPRPRARTLLGLLWPAVEPQFNAVVPEAGEGGTEASSGAVRMAWQRLPADFTNAVHDPVPEPRGLRGVPLDQTSEAAVEFSWVGPVARAAGTAMHAELERLAMLGEVAMGDLPARVEACAAQLREQGVEPGEARQSAQAVVRRLQQLAGDERFRWLLFTPHLQAVSELRLTGRVAGVVRNVVIDRSFVDADGTRWVIDYKTGGHAGGGLEQFLAREVERYTPQLRLYAGMVRRLGPEPVRAALYFPWLGEFRELAI